MKNFSLAGVGMYVVLIEGLLHLVGLNPDPGTVEAAVNGGIAVAGFVLWVIGQVKRKDLKLGLVRK